MIFFCILVPILFLDLIVNPDESSSIILFFNCRTAFPEVSQPEFLYASKRVSVICASSCHIYLYSLEVREPPAPLFCDDLVNPFVIYSFPCKIIFTRFFFHSVAIQEPVIAPMRKSPELHKNRER